jgi:hypothetical protein
MLRRWFIRDVCGVFVEKVLADETMALHLLPLALSGGVVRPIASAAAP